MPADYVEAFSVSYPQIEVHGVYLFIFVSEVPIIVEGTVALEFAASELHGPWFNSERGLLLVQSFTFCLVLSHLLNAINGLYWLQ